MMLWRRSLLLLIGITLLLGCDNEAVHVENHIDGQQTELAIASNDPVKTIDNDNVDNATDSNPSPNVTLSDEELAKKYQHTSLAVLDSSEVILNGASTLVITFSAPLNPKQDFDNLVRLVEKDKKAVDGHWELSNNKLELHHRYLAPKQQLVVTIDKMLIDINHHQLGSTYQADITTRDRAPAVGFSSNGLLLPSKSMKGLPITTLNVNQVDINFFRIKPDKINDFMQNYGAVKQLSIWGAESALVDASLVYSARFNLSPKANVQENMIIDLSEIEALETEGVYIAILNQSGTYNYTNPVSVFSISNIGISAHAYQNGKLSIFAHRLDNGDALPHVKLTALCDSKNKQCNTVTGSTDKRGHAELKLESDVHYQLLIASDNKQLSSIYLDRNSLDLTEFNVNGESFYHKQLFTFGPRDLYRPGETVFLNALLRDANGELLIDQPIKGEVISATGQVVNTFTWQAMSKKSGFYQTQFAIPVNAPTGKWTFKLNLGDDIPRYHYFTVEEFLPERMALTLTASSDQSIQRNSDATFTAKSWYLYGAPASNNEILASPFIIRDQGIANLPGFKIGAITEDNINRQLDTITQSLDRQGIAQISVKPNNWQDIRSPIKLILQVSVLDIGGRPVTRSLSQSIWPADQLPAIRPLFAERSYYDWSLGKSINRAEIKPGEAANFDIAYVDVSGKKYATHNLVAKFIKEKRNYFWTWTESAGWQVEYDQKEFIVSQEKLNINDNAMTNISFLPDDEGAYRLEVIDESNHVMSSVRFWNGNNWANNADDNDVIRPDQIKLSLDKPAYSAGDTAQVHIDAPINGYGYLSLETNDGMLWMKPIKINQNSIDVDIPIEEWGRHDIYINAMVIRPSKDSSIQTIKRAVGLLYLPMDTEDRQLKLKIDAPKQASPNTVVNVKVSVPKSQRKNDKMTVLVSAVDVGVLNITDFITPDPYLAFLGRKRYNVEQFDVYGKLIEGNGRDVSMSFGGDSDQVSDQHLTLGGKKPLTNVKIVAQQLQTITLNSKGEADVELMIPDFNGELRLMAQVWNKNQFGHDEQSLTIAAPIIAELSTPRFLSGGDQAFMALELRNLTAISQTLSLKLTAEDLISLKSDEIPESITLNPQEQRIIQIPVRAEYGLGQGTITVGVDGIQLSNDKDYQLSRSWTIGVRPPYPAITRTQSMILKEGGKWVMPSSMASDLISNTMEGELMASHNPPLNITRYIKSLYAYPYGCLEQTISQLYPSLYVNSEQLEKMGIDGIADEERRKNIQTGIDRLFTMQRNNGSFGLWSKESQEEYWLTVYAVDFLLRAQERGYSVNQQGLDKAFTRIAQYLYDHSAFYNSTSYYNNDVSSYIEFSTKSYAVFILAKQQKVTPVIRNEIKRLYQQVAGNENISLFSPLPIMQLSIASKLTGNTRSAENLLDIALSTSRDNKYYWLGDYGSDIRDKAQVYNLMVEYQLASDIQADYLLKLIGLLDNEYYLSTQELNALFMASWHNLQKDSQQELVVLFDNERVKGENTIYRSMNNTQLSQAVSVRNPYSAPPLYVHFSLLGYTKGAPVPTSKDDVLSISRQYYDIKGNPITIANLDVGDTIIAVLDVSSDRVLTDALVVDMLPAGLELENPNLSDNYIDIYSIPNLTELFKGEEISDIKHQDYRDDRYVAAIDIRNMINQRYHTRLFYLARAVTIGNYAVPSPYVESMYKPEWKAIGETFDTMTINNRIIAQ